MKIKGKGIFTLTHKDGSQEVIEQDNIIVDSGFDFICDAIGNSARGNVMSYIAVGMGTADAASSQTALVAEIARQAATYAHTAGTKILTLTANFAAGVGTGAITEAGVLNASSAGTLLDRVVFAVINKGADDSLNAVFQFTLS